jgi:hypothetical protein
MNMKKNTTGKSTAKNVASLDHAVDVFLDRYDTLLAGSRAARYGGPSFNDLVADVKKLREALKHHRGEYDDVPRQKYENVPRTDNMSGGKGFIEKHESYGIVKIDRVGGWRRLFGSSVRHQHFFTLEIRRAQREVGGWGENFRSDGRIPIISIAMSAAQFVEMITTQNMGEGVPCTITDIEGVNMEDVPEQQTELSAIREIFEEKIVDVVDSMRASLKNLDALLEKKSFTKEDKANIRNIVYKAESMMRDHAPFILKLFGEHTEKMVVKGKTEVESFINLALHRAGVKAIRDNGGNLVLGSGDGTGED